MNAADSIACAEHFFELTERERCVHRERSADDRETRAFVNEPVQTIAADSC